MENPCILPSQLVIDADIGSRLLNAAVLRMASLDQASPRTRRRATPVHRLPPRFDSTITLGVAAMLAHCRQLLSGNPLEIMQDQDDRTIVRVCGALDYVVDKPNHRLFVRSADPSPRLMTNELGMTQLADTALTYESIELLSPLCKPLWLHFVAYRPDGICGHNTDADLFQLPLWEDNPDALELLNEICHRAYQRLRADPDFQRLRAALSYRLMEMVGPYTVDLALRARTVSNRWGLHAEDVSRVWKHQRLYHRMDRENPHLLRVLSAWLQHHGPYVDQGMDDAIPAMRRDLLAEGLPPRAWRYLVEHGPRALVFRADSRLTWSKLVDVLRQLHKARWPAPPPRGFLGLLNDTAGLPTSYMEPGEGVPGWFWQWACQEARACAHDPQRYRRLQDQVVQWAWLVREYRPRPDSNQQRRRQQWLQKWAEHQETITALNDQDSWGLWLRDVPWERIDRVRVVPLLSPRSLREEGLAMHNCADQFLQDCLDGNCLLLSLRQPDSGKRVALMSMERRNSQAEWEQRQLSGPCNRNAPAWVEPIVYAVAEMVRQGEEAERATRALLRAVSERTDTCTQGNVNDQATD